MNNNRFYDIEMVRDISEFGTGRSTCLRYQKSLPLPFVPYPGLILDDSNDAEFRIEEVYFNLETQKTQVVENWKVQDLDEEVEALCKRGWIEIE